MRENLYVFSVFLGTVAFLRERGPGSRSMSTRWDRIAGLNRIRRAVEGAKKIGTDYVVTVLPQCGHVVTIGVPCCCNGAGWIEQDRYSPHARSPSHVIRRRLIAVERIRDELLRKSIPPKPRPSNG